MEETFFLIIFLLAQQIFPQVIMLRVEDSDTGPLIHFITYPCDQNVKEITDAYG